ncbi:formamidopyrimidine-DNA glycosylase [Leuconostoc litchii]|uniref:Formamidopyrimidine-DNA glycosylase n=1 Tax=Leuconostoc litchii TaxID=1981069 RepID=A0A6P2CMY8_9LACO|nr:bifunctional DNA-formamidopyrimidine glycosylase/DNA-(apurinic or apyrimidinic site) lyase [Leuconostoc litchii]TYC47395.1 bifunctional DNA-formamidopyrimidine glycosylase/DNA-(apurinic or apyrimidinic site) lyase [Leuconostoc litchii]GMA69408.1 formamidopyrimidine-DNA glycosylase [Leuconostoc litchii]
MPELPEVETVRRGLEKLIVGSKITDVQLPYPKVITGDSQQFVTGVLNAEFEKISRRGKYLLLQLSNQHTIVSHLRMEGQYSVEPSDTEPYKHTEIIFGLSDNRALFYNDTRRFGRMILTTTGFEMTEVPSLAKLGPEPTEEQLTLSYMKTIFAKSKRPVKTFLLDQTQIAGIGNIYADEVLWQSKIHPKTPASMLSDVELIVLRENIITEIKRATDHHGTTVHSFSNVFGEVGKFQNELEAYGRVGESCLRCGATMIKIKVGQRGTTFCPVCQVEKK